MKHLSVSRIRRLSIGLGIMLFALVPLSLYLTRQTAAAQCGTSTSSCKNCHEVQGKDPVSTDGDWHTSHAFGDFCEFCHAGSVESKTQDEAHAGLVDPMGDVKASCQSCHPQDHQDKAQVYAATLGIHSVRVAAVEVRSGSSVTPLARRRGHRQRMRQAPVQALGLRVKRATLLPPRVT